MLRIKELRKAKKLTAKQLAEYIQVAESTMSLYESGKREPDFKTLLRIAEKLDTTVDHLLGKDISSTPIKKGFKIPVYGSVAAGVPIDAITDIEDYEEITEDLARTGSFAALKIKGASMEPKFSEGDVVIVRLQETAETGDIAIVMVNGDEATCKKIKKMPEGIMLISTNPDYEPMFFSNRDIAEKPVRIWGKVVELRAKF